MGVMKKLSDQMRTPKRKNALLGAREGFSAVARYERLQDKEKLKQFNDDVKAWSIDVTRQLRSNVRMLVKQDEQLSESIEPNVYFRNGEAERIGFSFAREGVYIHKGAGRGQGGFRGGSMGTGNRRPIRWFDPVIDKNLSFLADVVAEYAADMQMDATRIFVDKEDRE